jgi:hypothetical protein
MIPAVTGRHDDGYAAEDEPPPATIHCPRIDLVAASTNQEGATSK